MGRKFYTSKMYLFIKQENCEIDKLKWIESEKAGRDIGKDKAVFLRIKNHRSTWLTEYKSLCATS